MMRLHSGLPRQAPGGDACTLEALRRLPPLSSDACIYDLGCGPGRAALVLAGTLQQRVIAVDLQEEFLSQLRRNAAQMALTDLIETRCANMADLGDWDCRIDLIWSEGAIYCLGFDQALRNWQPLLIDNGIVVCSELSWLNNTPAEEAVAFWRKSYPAMRSVAENLCAAKELGYACLDHFTVPSDCWWNEYYEPLLDNVRGLSAEADEDEHLRAAIASALAETELYRKHYLDYGYEFYLLQKSVGIKP